MNCQSQFHSFILETYLLITVRVTTVGINRGFLRTPLQTSCGQRQSQNQSRRLDPRALESDRSSIHPSNVRRSEVVIEEASEPCATSYHLSAHRNQLRRGNLERRLFFKHNPLGLLPVDGAN